MEISRAATGLLAAICATVGAGGTYLIVRGSGETAQPAEVAAPNTTPTAVEQSEGVLPEMPESVPVVPRPAAAPRPTAPRAWRNRGGSAAPESEGHRTCSRAARASTRRVAGDRPRTVDSEQSQASRPIEPPAPYWRNWSSRRSR